MGGSRESKLGMPSVLQAASLDYLGGHNEEH